MKMLSGAALADGQERNGLRKKTLLIGGKVAGVFHHDSTKEAEAEAIKLADARAFEIIGRVEQRLGRKLTEKELLRGLEHPETQSAGDAIRQRQEWDSYFKKEVSDTRTPIERAVDNRRAELKGQGDPRLTGLLALREKEKLEEEKREAYKKKLADPRRTHCVEDARAASLATLFDETATAADVRRAEFMERLAVDGDVKTYEFLRREHQKQEAQKRRATAAPLYERAATLAAEAVRVEQPFTLPSVTTEFEPGEPVQ